MTDNLIVPLEEKDIKQIEQGNIYSAMFHETEKRGKIMILVAFDTTKIVKGDFESVLEKGVDIIPNLMNREQLERIKRHEGALMGSKNPILDVQVMVIHVDDYKKIQKELGI